MRLPPAPVPPNLAGTSLIQSLQLMPCMSEQQTNVLPSSAISALTPTPADAAPDPGDPGAWLRKFMSHSKMQLPRQHIKLYGRPQKNVCVCTTEEEQLPVAGNPTRTRIAGCINSDESLHLLAARWCNVQKQHPPKNVST